MILLLGAIDTFQVPHQILVIDKQIINLSSSVSSNSSQPQNSYIPLTTYLKLEQANVSAIHGNILLFCIKNKTYLFNEIF